MPTTTNKGYSVQVAGTNAGVWGAGNPGSDLNTGCFQVLDTNMAGVYSASLSSTNVTLSATDTQNCLLRFTGALLASIVVSPAGGALFSGFYYFENLTSGNFTVTITTGAGSVVLPQSRVGVVFIDGTNGPRILAIAGKTNADPIPVGTVMPFYQNAAPTGWTISSSLTDYAMRIVSSAGGVTSGSVNYSTLFARTATDSHTLTTNEIPSHTHSFQSYNSLAAGYTVAGPNAPNTYTTQTTAATGGGAGHTHDIDMRVKTADIILATKN